MPAFRSWTLFALLALVLACAPRTHTQTMPLGLRLRGELITYGPPETTLVSLSVPRQADSPSWQAEFTDGSREKIVAEDIPGLTILKWKLDRERAKTLTKQPFHLRLRSGEAAYTVTVSFTSAGQEFSGVLLAEVLVRLIIGR